jgi:hypothetical protein
LGIEFGEDAAMKGGADGDRRQGIGTGGGMEIEYGGFEAHSDIYVAAGETFDGAVGHFRGGENEDATGMVDKSGDGFIVGVDAADGLAVFILQGGEGAPLVDDEVGRGGGSGKAEEK